MAGFAAGYALKLTLRRETYDDDRSLRTDKIVVPCQVVVPFSATAILVAVDGHAAGVLTVADPVKATTSQALAELRGVQRVVQTSVQLGKPGQR